MIRRLSFTVRAVPVGIGRLGGAYDP